MIRKWNTKRYVGEIKEEVNKGWYVPSRKEWTAFADKLRITSSNYNRLFGLNGKYWSSSQRGIDIVYYIDLDYYGKICDTRAYVFSYVRIGATF